jgi:hypothetical protein
LTGLSRLSRKILLRSDPNGCDPNGCQKQRCRCCRGRVKFSNIGSIFFQRLLKSSHEKQDHNPSGGGYPYVPLAVLALLLSSHLCADVYIQNPGQPFHTPPPVDPLSIKYTEYGDDASFEWL